MTSLLILRHIEVENANTIAGLTYGFPAVSNFLGFTHALSRKLQQSHGLTLGCCAIVSHQQHIQAYKPNPWKDAVLCLTRNPITKKNKTPTVVEEGRMHLTVSLLIECNFDDHDFNESPEEFTKYIQNIAVTQRLAGGTIINIKAVDLIEPPEDIEELKQFTRQQMFKLLPGFVLVERSELLAEHFRQLQAKNADTQLIDAWLDFVALKYAAQPMPAEHEELNEHTKAKWNYLSKPADGWLVPITAGYRAISEIYPPGKVANTRDPDTPFCFVEPAYTIGEWLSPHRIRDFKKIFWQYHADPMNGWYLCKNNYSAHAEK